jgi:hypothetical protein
LDFSKLKLELYDFLGLILPGLIAISEIWITVRGWHGFLLAITQMSGTGLTLLLVFSFAAGNIIQELGDVAVKTVKGQRYLRKARDRFWTTAEAEVVRGAIKKAAGNDPQSVDSAFDYCLSGLKDRFTKRDMFVATSDLCRSFVVLSVLGIVPAVRVAFYDLSPSHAGYPAAGLLITALAIVCLLAWRRMVRFRELSETTVFRTYLATLDQT